MTSYSQVSDRIEKLNGNSYRSGKFNMKMVLVKENFEIRTIQT